MLGKSTKRLGEKHDKCFIAVNPSQKQPLTAGALQRGNAERGTRQLCAAIETLAHAGHKVALRLQ